MTTTQTQMTNIFRVVIPTADGDQVAGEFPTLLNASLFQQVILTDRNLKCEVEWFRDGRRWMRGEIDSL
jgi:hypothetical protein